MPEPSSPLRTRKGYIFTVSQLEGGRPLAQIACTSCTWHEPVPMEVDVSTEGVAFILTAAMRAWRVHPHRGYVDTDISEQVESAGGTRC